MSSERDFLRILPNFSSKLDSNLKYYGHRLFDAINNNRLSSIYSIDVNLDNPATYTDFINNPYELLLYNTILFSSVLLTLYYQLEL